MLETFGIMVHVGKSILPQDRRFVVIWIQGNAHQVRFFIVVGIFRQLFLNGGELSTQQRTIIGKGTARVNESKKNDLPFELRRNAEFCRPD